jgi:predicted kinase
MPKSNACWILFAGPTGSGKTTAARELASNNGGVVFSIDQWMNNLFWMDLPAKDDLPWALDRIARCETQIAAMAEELAATGVSAILDLGFTQRAQRLNWLDRAKAAGVKAELRTVDAPAGERWQRVEERNRGESATHAFEVTRDMFDGMEQRWEAPDAEERAAFAASAAS